MMFDTMTYIGHKPKIGISQILTFCNRKLYFVDIYSESNLAHVLYMLRQQLKPVPLESRNPKVVNNGFASSRKAPRNHLPGGATQFALSESVPF
jgi:hypothetical protein